MTTAKRGKPVNLYLREADVAKIRELMTAILGQGERVSESLIVRAALHAAKPGRAFLQAYKEAASADLRYKRVGYRYRDPTEPRLRLGLFCACRGSKPLIVKRLCWSWSGSR